MHVGGLAPDHRLTNSRSARTMIVVGLNVLVAAQSGYPSDRSRRDIIARCRHSSASSSWLDIAGSAVALPLSGKLSSPRWIARATSLISNSSPPISIARSATCDGVKRRDG